MAGAEARTSGVVPAYRVMRTLVGYRIIDERTGWYASSVVYGNDDVSYACAFAARLTAARVEWESCCGEKSHV